MPVIEDIESKPRPPKRTWRELPPSPPLGAPLPPPDPATMVVGTPVEAVPPPPRPRGRRRWVVPVVAIAGVAALLGAAAVVWNRENDKVTPTVSAGEKGSPAAVAKALGPAVVQLDVDGGLGSGVIYDTKGLVLTAHHVVASTDEPRVKLADGSTHDGRVVGRAPERDLAIVAIDNPGEVTAARLAEPGTVEVGEPVVALGSPYGFQASVTSGIVSGLDRELETPVGTLTGLIQTDTAINPGNSGGPLADADAIVIGITTAIASSSGGSDGVGFAIPVEVARDLIAQVEKAGGAAAPTVPAPEDQGGLGGLIPGLPNIPGIDKLLPNLDDLLGGSGSGDLGGIIDDLLNGLLGQDPSQLPGSTPQVGLFTLKDLPSGYTQGRSQIETEQGKNGVQGTHRVELEGADGAIVVEAERGPDAADRYDHLKGDAVRVAGTGGKKLSDGAVAYMGDDDLLIVITPDNDVPSRDVNAVADAIEVIK